MKEHTQGNRLITGSNCYFDYETLDEHKHTGQPLQRPPPPLEPMAPRMPQTAGALEPKTPTKKKKKKKKGKSAADATGGTVPAVTGAQFSVNDVSLADPDADYPESRLIKVGPNGDLIVESLDDEFPRQPDEGFAKRMVPPVLSIPRKLAHKILAFDGDQQQFWDELSVEAQKQMFTIDATAITESVRQQQKDLASRNIQADGAPSHEHLWTHNSHSKCYCSRCERNDLHILNIIDEGFDTYMEELIEGLWEQFELQYHDLKPGTKFIDVTSAENVLHDKYIEAQNIQRFAEIKQIETAGANAGEMLSTVRNLELFYYIENIIIPMIQREFTAQALTTRLSAEDRRAQFDTLSCVHQILRLIQSRNDRNRLLRETQGEGVRPLSPKEFRRMAVADNLIDCLYTFLKEGLPGISKAMEFVKILSSVGRAGSLQFPDVTEQMSQFADMFESDDKAFIDLVAKWKASESDEHLEHATEGEDEGEEEENAEEEHYALKNPFSHCKCDFHNQLSHQFTSARAKALAGKHELNYNPEFEEHNDVDEEFDDDHECEHDHHDSDNEEDDIDDSIEDPGTDEEEAEERRFKELRGFFFMEARKIIVRRFQESYKKRVSDDRTKKFIEELEAEENAKKEKELKKLKQKEKQKEKKRLQQLEKEEKRKQKEAEEQEKAALLKKKQEELRAEQKRREEELRLKKEKEKLKKIEALRQKDPPSETKNTTDTEAQSNSPARDHASDSSSVVLETKKAPGKEKKNKVTPELKTSTFPLEDLRHPLDTSTSSRESPVPSIPQPISLKEPLRQNSGIDPQQLLLGSDKAKKQPKEEDKVSFIPPKNHLLEQLYHARPRTVSTTSGDSIDFLNEPGTASRMGTSYSPSKKSVLAYQPDTWIAGNTNLFPSDAIVPPSLERPQFFGNSNGASNTWTARNPQDAFSVPLLASPLMSGLPLSSLWNQKYPRGNSIWGASSLVNAEAQTQSLWGSQTSQTDIPKSSASSNFNKELVQSAAFKAVQEVHSSAATNSGSSPAMRIFQTVKTIMNDSSIKMSEFLLALHSSTKYQFEIVYDDFGSVTDIHASIQPERIFGASSVVNRSPSPQQTHIPPLFHSQPTFNQREHGVKFAGFVPSPLPVSQPMSQPSFQPGLNPDPFPPSTGPFQPSLAMNPPFLPNTRAPNLQILAPESSRLQQGSLHGSSENVSQFDSSISGTMQGSLSQLGIAQMRNGIW
ncbi:hypothetical protein METBIDRAFT_134064 [Metschnikowia bicuspidata var. bicuspidata NRRL YB-4993]|uniref:Stress response protein NST1 n=1 Tax=Metschnikowia bicuspidata var. bicuspidata NRRL YB-4993 TaxID=869754 RepID=A0A1A0HKG6_9ASCO|nr:hypothetical protein METBIDRAFT_134064 [Metschnikowia bicuspidata var. bicuspidata NRRL YB-4993]OBA24481.1 hypothetical protein METBIDRAFT_134064 [Metschnikowia bicuspidata var. bicuspidata NRRL YB-4993]